MQITSDAPANTRLAWRPKVLAKALGISERQVYRLEEQGRLKGVKIGRAKVFTDESVRDLLSNEQAAAA